jgi:hypothetical protein
MKRVLHLLVVLLGLCMLGGWTTGALAQDKPTQYMISIYHVAPGKHLDFLKWMAEREAVSDEAGAPPTQWYTHMNGATWDYVTVSRLGTPEEQAAMDKKIEEMTKKKGLTTGVKASLEFRGYINEHTDTYTMGPYTAAEMVKAAEGK